jgi:hypothetical protein
MTARVPALEADGLLAPGQRHEDVVVVRGRKPARTGRRVAREDDLLSRAW